MTDWKDKELTSLCGKPDQRVFHDNVTGTLCGNFLEVSIHPSPIKSGEGQQPKTVGRNRQTEPPEGKLKRSIARSQKAVRQLCNTNGLYVLYTLTFATRHIDYLPGEKPFLLVSIEEQKDRECMLERWRAFARKMRDYERSKDREFHYITVIEKHTGKRAKDTTIKKNTYHVHFLTNRIHSKRLIQHKWGHGLVNYSDWRVGRKSNDLQQDYDDKPPDNPGAYASKYLGKDMEEECVGRKRYWASRTLNKPLKLHGEEALRLALSGKNIYENTTTRDYVDTETGEKKGITHHTATYVLKTSKQPLPKEKTKKQRREEKARIRLQISLFRKRVQANKQKEKEAHDRDKIDKDIEATFTRKLYLDQNAIRLVKTPEMD